MPFNRKGPEPLDVRMHFRITSSEKARLKENADLAGISLSDYMRRRCLGRPIIANTDAIMIRELRRLGGLLKNIHNESQGIYSKETADTLIALKEYIKRLIEK